MEIFELLAKIQSTRSWTSGPEVNGLEVSGPEEGGQRV